MQYRKPEYEASHLLPNLFFDTLKVFLAATKRFASHCRGPHGCSATSVARAVPQFCCRSASGLMHRSKRRARESIIYSITSSARPSSVIGKVRPSDLAVLRLMTSSAFTDC
jgi:hypothetical protein